MINQRVSPWKLIGLQTLKYNSSRTSLSLKSKDSPRRSSNEKYNSKELLNPSQNSEEVSNEEPLEKTPPSILQRFHQNASELDRIPLIQSMGHISQAGSVGTNQQKQSVILQSVSYINQKEDKIMQNDINIIEIESDYQEFENSNRNTKTKQSMVSIKKQVCDLKSLQKRTKELFNSQMKKNQLMSKWIIELSMNFFNKISSNYQNANQIKQQKVLKYQQSNQYRFENELHMANKDNQNLREENTVLKQELNNKNYKIEQLQQNIFDLQQQIAGVELEVQNRLKVALANTQYEQIYKRSFFDSGVSRNCEQCQTLLRQKQKLEELSDKIYSKLQQVKQNQKVRQEETQRLIILKNQLLEKQNILHEFQLDLQKKSAAINVKQEIIDQALNQFYQKLKKSEHQSNLRQNYQKSSKRSSNSNFTDLLSITIPNSHEFSKQMYKSRLMNEPISPSTHKTQFKNKNPIFSQFHKKLSDVQKNKSKQKQFQTSFHLKNASFRAPLASPKRFGTVRFGSPSKQKSRQVFQLDEKVRTIRKQIQKQINSLS